jgi:hypothetical protein
MSEIKINSQGEVKLYDSDNSNYVGLKAPATVASDETFVLPSADGSANFLLRTDGSGNLSFIDVAGLTEPGIDWQSSIKTTGFTAVSGEGYFCNTTSGAFTATLPSSPTAGDIVAFKDYAATFATNNLTIGRNSSNIQGASTDSVLSTNRASVVLVYVDATKGWLYVQESNVGDLENKQYVTATGGTETTSGDFKIHTFTSSGTFTVSSAGNSAGSNSVDYLVVAGGAGGGHFAGGGGGAGGGYRESFPNPATGGLPVTAQAYPITVGAGGGPSTSLQPGNPGSNSIFSSITSAGGGGGGYGGDAPGNTAGADGGSGGGGGAAGSGQSAPIGGAGNTPPVSPSQGNNGGTSIPLTNPSTNMGGGGGGGAGAVGGNAPGSGGAGGAGATSTIPGSPLSKAGGGGGGAHGATPGSGGAGGSGGGAAGGNAGPAPNVAPSASANTGGGGGGGSGLAGVNPGTAGSGGSGVVVIRYKYQN